MPAGRSFVVFAGGGEISEMEEATTIPMNPRRLIKKISRDWNRSLTHYISFRDASISGKHRGRTFKCLSSRKFLIVFVMSMYLLEVLQMSIPI